MNDYGYGNILINKITNGSKIEIGSDKRKCTLIVDQHFNWFQKLMMKWCFGFAVTDYSED